MQTIFVETLILGASYAALGYAAAHPGTLIVEETEGTGVEYAGNMRPSDLVDLPVTELGKQFYAFLKEHELVTEEGRLDLCGMTTAVNRYAVAHKLWILLDAAVVSVKNQTMGMLWNAARTAACGRYRPVSCWIRRPAVSLPGRGGGDETVAACIVQRGHGRPISPVEGGQWGTSSQPWVLAWRMDCVVPLFGETKLPEARLSG
ncbi:MAG: hypothetical protein ACLR23_25940 [Clostridia bacterium]